VLAAGLVPAAMLWARCTPIRWRIQIMPVGYVTRRIPDRALARLRAIQVTVDPRRSGEPAPHALLATAALGAAR
jgi:hypothetical protein